MRLRRRNVNFLILSTLLHLSILAVFLKRKKTEDPVEIELIPAGKEDKGFIEDGCRIVDKEPSVTPVQEKPKNGFWGIGIEIDPFYHSTVTEHGTYNGWYIVKVPIGYPADELGLQVGDIIVTINGNPISGFNDVRGSGPDPITFEVFRNGQLYTFTTNRAFINED